MKTLDQLAAKFRDAVAADEFERALDLWSAYATRLRAALESGPGAARRLEDARLLLRWARPAILAARARAWNEWSALELRQGYAPPARRACHTVQITG